MKLLLISDIHGNIDALRAVLAAEPDADAIACAGDIVDWGFYPHEVIALLQEKKALCVTGNHDREILWRYDGGEREEPGRETNYSSLTVNRLTPEDVAWLRALPETLVFRFDGITYCMRHAVDVHEQVCALLAMRQEHRLIPAFDELWSKFVGNGNGNGYRNDPERRLLFGHTHVCSIIAAKPHEAYLNPGSIHYRLGADAWTPGADYMVVMDGVPQLRHVDFPTAHLRRMIEESDFREDIKRPALVYAASAVD